jgi:hypothetical protein
MIHGGIKKMIRSVDEDTILLFADFNLAEMFGIVAFVILLILIFGSAPNKN